MNLSRVVVVIFVLSRVMHAQDELSPDRFAKQLAPILERTLLETGIPGIAVGVVEDGKPIYSRGFGFMKIGENSEPITPKSVFHMASLTKTFVAAALLQLAENKKIDLDATVKSYLPYFSIHDERVGRITVRQMLSHTSGMPDTENYGWDKPEYDDLALERYVRSLGNLELVDEPGAKFSYSNIAYEVLGDVVAKTSGQSFESYVEEHLLKPVGMKSSTLFVEDVEAKQLAFGHTKTRSGSWVVIENYPYNRAHSPSSNLHSSIEDMSLWAIMNLQHGAIDGKQILEEKWFEEIWQPVANVSKLEKIGTCWFLEDYKGEQVIKHLGSDDGFLTALLLIPSKKTGVVILVNSDNAPLRYLVNQALAVSLGRVQEIDL